MNDLLARVQARCIEVGDCWEWQGATNSCSTPVFRWGGKTASVRRVLLVEYRGVSLNARVATYKCGNSMCVNPEHIESITRTRLSKRAAVSIPTNMLWQSKLASHARKRSRLTPELVAEIRAAEGTQRQIATQFGICQATVSYIRANKVWRDYTNPFAQLFGSKK